MHNCEICISKYIHYSICIPCVHNLYKQFNNALELVVIHIYTHTYISKPMHSYILYTLILSTFILYTPLLYTLILYTTLIQVTVTGEVSKLRLLTPYETYAADIEKWYLTQFTRICIQTNQRLKTTKESNTTSHITPDNNIRDTSIHTANIHSNSNNNNNIHDTYSNIYDKLELFCIQFNNTIPCPGVSPTADTYMIKTCLVTLIQALQYTFIYDIQHIYSNKSDIIILYIQIIYKLLSCIEGYKYFLTISEVNIPILLLHLLQYDNEFIHYWCINIISILCICPIVPRSMKYEYINKHILLNDNMLYILISLMSTRILNNNNTTTDSSGTGNSGTEPKPEKSTGLGVLGRKNSGGFQTGMPENGSKVGFRTDYINSTESDINSDSGSTTNNTTYNTNTNNTNNNEYIGLDNPRSNDALLRARSFTTNATASQIVSYNNTNQEYIMYNTNANNSNSRPTSYRQRRQSVAPNPSPLAHLPNYPATTTATTTNNTYNTNTNTNNPKNNAYDNNTVYSESSTAISPRSSPRRKTTMTNDTPLPYDHTSTTNTTSTTAYNTTYNTGAGTAQPPPVPNFNLAPNDDVAYPNWLVIISCANLLESILCTERDTTSPELLNKIYDLLYINYEVIIYMLRSSSFILMENAAILMFILLKHRPNISIYIQNIALSECLILKHFQLAVYSISYNQRLISRFLISTW